MNDLPIQTYESVVQQRDALATENKALIEQAEEVYAAGYNHGHLNTVDGIAYSAGTKDEFYQLAIELMNEAETPATDAFIRERMAKGVELFAEHLGSNEFAKESSMAYRFVDRLRKGINDAQ